MSSSLLAVEMRGVSKHFPGVVANDQVDFGLRHGEIHALLGENGAGKSTLMNILTGLYRPDEGSLSVNGQLVEFRSPRDAIRHGIGMVHQHFMLVPTQTVTENILLGLKEPRFHLDLSRYHTVIAELGERYGLPVDPRARIWQLSVGEQQRVEILKMLYRGAQVLILDEPTAVLAPTEIDEFFDTLRSMVAAGKSIVFISHKLDEVAAVADRITVLRKGKVTAAGLEAGSVDKAELARLMVGREVLFRLDKTPAKPGKEILRVTGLEAENDKGLPALRGVDLYVCAGEIVGLAGVAGNGQAELAEAISGQRPVSAGRVDVFGQTLVAPASGRTRPSQRIRRLIDAGVSHVPEDRTHVGTAPNLSLTDNIIMKEYRQAPIASGMAIDSQAAAEHASGLKQSFDIMAPSIRTPARMLSGGNLQRLILAREISGQPQMMVAVQPTRGLDVGAIESVQRLLLEQRDRGAGVLLISEELEELMALSDRLYVIHGGEIMGELDDPGAGPERIGLMMTGTRQADLPPVQAQ